MGIEELTEEELQEMGKKEFRKEFPSGWMELSRYETLVLVIDALLESSPTREFTFEELAEQSGSTPRSVESHLDSLVRLGVIEELEDRDPVRYSLNDKSPITQKLYELNLTVDRVKEGEIPQTLNREDRAPVSKKSNTFDSGSVSNTNNFQPEEAALRAD